MLPLMADESNVIDLDALIAARIQKNLDERILVQVRVAGQEWSVQNTGSVTGMLALLDSQDGTGLLEWMVSCVVEDQRAAFRKALAAYDGLDFESLTVIVDGFAKAAVGRPTESSSDSPRTSPKPRSGTRSKGSSRSGAVIDATATDAPVISLT